MKLEVSTVPERIRKWAMLMELDGTSPAKIPQAVIVDPTMMYHLLPPYRNVHIHGIEIDNAEISAHILHSDRFRS